MTADRLLVQPSDELGERKSPGRHPHPGHRERQPAAGLGRGHPVGPTVRNVEAGDHVLFAPDAGFEVEIRGEEYLILRERDVHAIASERASGQTGLYL